MWAIALTAPVTDLHGSQEENHGAHLREGDWTAVVVQI